MEFHVTHGEREFYTGKRETIGRYLVKHLYGTLNRETRWSLGCRGK